jgi:uncharacterized membrane protein
MSDYSAGTPDTTKVDSAIKDFNSKLSKMVDKDSQDYKDVANTIKLVKDARDAKIPDKDIMEALNKKDYGDALKKLVDSKKSNSTMIWIILLIMLVVVVAVAGFFLYRKNRASITNAYFY